MSQYDRLEAARALAQGGFSVDDCIVALRNSNDNLERAAALLYQAQATAAPVQRRVAPQQPQVQQTHQFVQASEDVLSVGYHCAVLGP